MSQEAVEASEDAAERDEDRLLRALYEVPRGSLGKLGERLGWKKRKVQTLMDRLAADKLAAQVRNKKYEITDKGRDAIGALKMTISNCENRTCTRYEISGTLSSYRVRYDAVRSVRKLLITLKTLH